MKCKDIDHEVIQKFIDEEVTIGEKGLINAHLLNCESCSARVDAQRQLAFNVGDAFNALVDDTIEIPDFVGRSKNQPIYRKAMKVLIYSISAACILLFMWFLTEKNGFTVRDELIIVNTFSGSYDANRKISEQAIIIEVIDAQGRREEYLQ